MIRIILILTVIIVFLAFLFSLCETAYREDLSSKKYWEKYDKRYNKGK